MTQTNILFLTSLLLCLIVIAYNFKSQNESKLSLNKIPLKPYDPLEKNRSKRLQMAYLKQLKDQ